MENYNIESGFVEKKSFKTILPLLKELFPSERVTAISFWQCSKRSGQVVSSGASLYRKPTVEEGRKMVLLHALKLKHDQLTLDGQTHPQDLKLKALLLHCSQHVVFK